MYIYPCLLNLVQDHDWDRLPGVSFLPTPRHFDLGKDWGKARGDLPSR
jgi:hypothetical protein